MHNQMYSTTTKHVKINITRLTTKHVKINFTDNNIQTCQNQLYNSKYLLLQILPRM